MGRLVVGLAMVCITALTAHGGACLCTRKMTTQVGPCVKCFGLLYTDYGDGLDDADVARICRDNLMYSKCFTSRDRALDWARENCTCMSSDVK